MSSLESVFLSYCGVGHKDMDARGFIRLCRAWRFIDERFTASDAEAVFLKVIPVARRRLNYNQFRDAVKLMADRKGCNVDHIFRQLALEHTTSAGRSGGTFFAAVGNVAMQNNTGGSAVSSTTSLNNTLLAASTSTPDLHGRSRRGRRTEASEDSRDVSAARYEARDISLMRSAAKESASLRWQQQSAVGSNKAKLGFAAPMRAGRTKPVLDMAHDDAILSASPGSPQKHRNSSVSPTAAASSQSNLKATTKSSSPDTDRESAAGILAAGASETVQASSREFSAAFERPKTNVLQMSSSCPALAMPISRNQRMPSRNMPHQTSAMQQDCRSSSPTAQTENRSPARDTSVSPSTSPSARAAEKCAPSQNSTLFDQNSTRFDNKSFFLLSSNCPASVIRRPVPAKESAIRESASTSTERAPSSPRLRQPVETCTPSQASTLFAKKSFFQMSSNCPASVILRPVGPPKDNTKESRRSEGLSPRIEQTFLTFCAGHVDMDCKGFVKLLKRCGLLDQKFTVQDARMLYGVVVPVGQHCMDMGAFREALKHVAFRTGLDVTVVRQIVAGHQTRSDESPDVASKMTDTIGERSKFCPQTLPEPAMDRLLRMFHRSHSTPALESATIS
eukprot:TRINITY_DN24869_c0_g1_i1.p1 TRINITY_DN24869_c0_g1~~TRINITY_DN24869_c0_g1_i1.p1  ORF type:complete len:661 (+),score=37.80 TRINITY_DN24869_c0_g1_i1:126-1985(+)